MEQQNKQHKTKLSGAKQSKKALHDKEKRGLELEPNRGNNNKAFAGQHVGSRKVIAAKRNIDRQSANMHMPVEDKSFNLTSEAPLVVAVVGPPGCGKTTFIRSMTKFYASRSLQQLRGPLTVAAGRSRRITFLEVPNTLSAMCDVAKIADVVILMIDGAFGFEMETFEFLSIAQVHGFPRAIGVISHLDQLKTNKQLKKTKRLLRHRFWHEVSEGANVVCLAPMINNLYRSADVLKLHRLLMTIEPKIQSWRNTHGCVLIDRHEDITDADATAKDPNCDRTIAFYGYVRGHPIKGNQQLHIPGLGDFDMAHISVQEDPCPPMAHQDKAQGNKLRHLSTKHKKIYAPYSDVGGIVYDEDSVYVFEDPDRQNTSRTGEGLQMLRELQKVDAIDSRLRRPVEFANEDTLDLAVGDIESGSDASDEDDAVDDGDSLHEFGDALNADANADAEEGEGLQPRPNHAPDTVRVHSRTTRFDWSDPVYQQKLKTLFVTGVWKDDQQEDDDANGEKDDSGSDYGSKGYESVDEDESGSVEDEPRNEPEVHLAASASNRRSGAKASRAAADIPEVDAPPVASNRNAQVQELLDFFISKDLGTESTTKSFMDEITASAGAGKNDGAADDAEAVQQTEAEMDAYVKKKMEKKKMFDGEYDVDSGKNNTTRYYQHLLEEQEEKKRAMRETLQIAGDDLEKKITLIGFFSGLYVRFVLAGVPVEFLRSFDPKVPMFAGALSPGEELKQVIHGRIKRHRWHPKILKAQDPLCISIGWRRIQTQPVFATEDPNGRHRYLKYTPKHMHCICAFYGPVVPPNTGFIAIPVKNTRASNFRPCASGFTIGADANASIVKKLKLTGYPDKVEKTTCFVKGMFNSDIEAAKFVGAKVKAVSGIRGIIKKVLKGKRGLVRCSFEDKLLMSDIVFLRAWKAVEPTRYCEDVRNLLVADWIGMRSMAELRRDLNLPIQSNPDSAYREIKKRKEVDLSAPLRVALSRNMRLNLPFEHKEEYVPLVEEKNVVARVRAATAVVPEPHEVAKQALLDTLTRKDSDLDAHQKMLRHNARKKAVKKHKDDQLIMDRKIRDAKKEMSKRKEFKSQRKSRGAGKKE